MAIPDLQGRSGHKGQVEGLESERLSCGDEARALQNSTCCPAHLCVQHEAMKPRHSCQNGLASNRTPVTRSSHMVLRSGTGRKGHSPHSRSYGRQMRAGELCPVKVLNRALHGLFASKHLE